MVASTQTYRLLVLRKYTAVILVRESENVKNYCSGLSTYSGR